MDIREANQSDIPRISDIYQACFPRERDHRVWVEATFNAAPRCIYYVIEQDGAPAGYILWCVKNGFRKNTIAELEQIGVHPDHTRKGLARKLIDTSFAKFKKHISDRGYAVGAIFVTTSEGHFAEDLYISTLEVSRSAVISDYGNGNEVILYRKMLPRDE
ncbi:GNAT family N-acetyltransferase [Fodinibius sediminis]|uniref:Ribosomal protein S18 acetylase RimI n=1 Tax=Fodinibius sediminis TaxID=1214077 RepID=A0A521BDQ2_9BACT|nr:GNAT family N-acetyltransferase [Fodinibius sediminis]SMO45217.1 Ribosomal protein S18 acetylase RimI [Fodinibius sediminis]